MINYITGSIRSLTREPGRAVIVAGGVGYEISLPTYVYQSLTSDGIGPGSDVELEIYYHVTDRQPKPMLVGFRHPTEKAFFEQLIQVEGIGPAKAAAALVFPVSTIASAIETEDLGSLQRLPGIGSRPRRRLLRHYEVKWQRLHCYRMLIFRGKPKSIKLPMQGLRQLKLW